MRKLIVEEWISLDGFAADKNDSTDFFRDISPEQKNRAEQDQMQLMRSVDAILLGRKTYELFSGFWPQVKQEDELMAGPINSIRKLIFSNTLTQTPWGDHENAALLTGDAIERIRELKEMEGGSMIVWGSISLVQQLLEQGLVDELHVTFCPVLLGRGLPLFSGLQNSRSLALKETRNYETGYVYHNYQLQKQ